ncbi:MAG: AAA-like domain-containing protein, partial [Chloroflexota bacterium]
FLDKYTFNTKRQKNFQLPYPDLEKPIALITAIRDMAQNCLYDGQRADEYYQGLILYLLGALAYHSLNQDPTVKPILFWAAATLTSLQFETETTLFSEDGDISIEYTSSPHLTAPQPSFDAGFLQKMEAPGGAVKLSDQFYIERDADELLRNHLTQFGTTTTIRAPRQSGKTSLLMRGLHHAMGYGARTIYLDFQSFDPGQFSQLDDFLFAFAEIIGEECELDEMLVGQMWQRRSAPQRKLQRFMENHVLQSFEMPLVLVIDEADRLLRTDYYQDFFGLLRSWHNRRTLPNPHVQTTWGKLNIVLVISTEPYLLIDDVNQSPFNVGLDLSLQDFDLSQVQELNQRHGTPLPENALPDMMTLLGGHPYLTRLALFTMVAQTVSWSELVRNAVSENGPFGRHLRSQYWNIHDKPAFRQALREIRQTQRCLDEKTGLLLQRAGIIRKEGDLFTFRCDLYRQYFQTMFT